MSRIILGEGDAFLFEDGAPRNVIVTIEFGNNERIVFPYSAEKNISQLFTDVKKINHAPSKLQMPFSVEGSIGGGITYIKSPENPLPITIRGKFSIPEIEREDIVLCVVSEPRDEGVDADKIPVVGKEYRIINIIMKNGVLQHYEVLDDASPTPIRMMMLPHEVTLQRKHVVKQKVSKLETIMKCDCGEDVALVLEGETYNGKCGRCGCVVSKLRVKA